MFQLVEEEFLPKDPVSTLQGLVTQRKEQEAKQQEILSELQSKWIDNEKRNVKIKIEHLRQGPFRPIGNTHELMKSIKKMGFAENSRFLVLPLGGGWYRVIDGNHRRFALVRMEMNIEVYCDVLKADTPPSVLDQFARLYNDLNAG